MAQGSAGNGAKDAEVQSLSRRRPGMDLFRASLEILDEPGMPADHAVMIGDSEYDMEMAQNAGRNSIAVSYGVHDRSRLLKV